MQQLNTKYFRYGSRPIFQISGNWGVAVTVDRFSNKGVRVFSLMFMIRYMELNVICHFCFQKFNMQHRFIRRRFNWCIDWFDVIQNGKSSILCHRKNIIHSNTQKQSGSFHQTAYQPNLPRTLKWISIIIKHN